MWNMWHFILTFLFQTEEPEPEPEPEVEEVKQPAKRGRKKAPATPEIEEEKISPVK